MTIMANEGNDEMERPESGSGHTAEHAAVEHRHVEEHTALSSRHLAAHENLYARHREEHASLADRHVTDHERATGAMGGGVWPCARCTPGSTWGWRSATRPSTPG
jgi:hypothetical protein